MNFLDKEAGVALVAAIASVIPNANAESGKPTGRPARPETQRAATLQPRWPPAYG